MGQNLTIVQYAVDDIERMARAFAVSKLFGVSTPEQALALCLIAQAEGRHPASAALDYDIVQNKPAKKAQAMLRDFLANGGRVEWHELSDAKVDATFSHPSGGSARIHWDMARAKQAGINNPLYAKYPRAMLRSRVVSEGVRTVFPMATSGMYVPEEVADMAPPAVTVSPSITVIPNKRAREALAAPAPSVAPGAEADPFSDEPLPSTVDPIKTALALAKTWKTKEQFDAGYATLTDEQRAAVDAKRKPKQKVEI